MLREPISGGILPVKQLWLRYRFLSIDNFPIVGGIVPVNDAHCRYIYDTLVKSPMESGICFRPSYFGGFRKFTYP